VLGLAVIEVVQAELSVAGGCHLPSISSSRFTPPDATLIMAPRGSAKGKQAQKPAEAPAKTIWYLLVDHQRQLSFGACTQIAVQADTNVDDLKKRIKEEKPNDLRPFDANKLEVWTYTHKNFSSLSESKKLQEIVGRIDFLKGGKNLKHRSPGQKMTKIDLPEDGILLVQAPPPQTTDTAGGGDGESFIRLAPTQHV